MPASFCATCEVRERYSGEHKHITMRDDHFLAPIKGSAWHPLFMCSGRGSGGSGGSVSLHLIEGLHTLVKGLVIVSGGHLRPIP